MEKYFLCFEENKLFIVHPDLTNGLIIGLFIILVVLTGRKKKSVDPMYKLLDQLHSAQLKGMAIFFVVLGHLWVHVALLEPFMVFSGDAVALFLFLSGFGLTCSTRDNFLSFKAFFVKRVTRVMVPYWLVTFFVLLLDYFLLGRVLPAGSLIWTFLGINITENLRHLDYVRWFVTFILLWYSIFYIIYVKVKSEYSLVIMVIVSFFLLIINYYIYDCGWYQFYSFPAGVFVSIYYDRIIKYYSDHSIAVNRISWMVLMYVFCVKYFMSSSIFTVILGAVPNILFEFFYEINSILLVFCCIFLTGRIIENGFSSRLLVFLGKYSYEIFLLHGIFLIKYNPVIKSTGLLLLSREFVTFMVFVSLLAVLSRRVQGILLRIKKR